MNLLQKINFRQPKYVLPAILYPLILGTGWLVIQDRGKRYSGQKP